MNAMLRTLTCVGVLAAVLGVAPRVASAASASVSTTVRADGGVVVTATAIFASCPPNSYGSLRLASDSTAWLCSGGGQSSASCTGLVDRYWLHGTHPFTAFASDCTGSTSSSASLTLDNTPMVAVTSPSGMVSGPFDILGTVTFKPTLSATKGTIYLYINNANTWVTKVCSTESCAFSYQEVMRSVYDLPHGGPYSVTLIATGGGASASAQQTFSVDKTPSITVTEPSGVISGPFDMRGTATFKPTLSPTKGTISLYINNAGAPTVVKSCSTETCAFSYKEIRGTLHEMSHGGPYTVELIARGGGASASAKSTFSVDQTPTVTVTTPRGVVVSPFDITGTATFKPTLSATKGTIYLYVNNANTAVSRKTCTTETCAFSYRALTGGLYALPPGGPYTVELIAWSSSAPLASSQQTFRVANCRDTDGDGFFGVDPVSCPPPLGNDCNDNDATIYPGAPEQCNGKDNNCNGVTAEGACDGMCVPFASSLNPASGALRHDQELFATRGGTGLPTRLSLYYHSLDIPRSALGTGWMHSYEMALTEMAGGSVILRQGDGRRRVYHPTNSGYRAQAGDYATLTTTDDGWQLVEQSGLAQHFDREGRILALVDRQGNRLTFQYVGGQLTTVRDAAGRTTTFAYNLERRLSLILDPNGNRHTFSYQGPLLTAVTTADTSLGIRSWTYTYTAGALLLSKTDPNGQTTRYTYDAANRIVSSTTPDGQVLSVSYDPTAPLTRLTASDGGVWSYRYDPRLGVVTHTTNALGQTTVSTYDPNKQRMARLDPDGSVTRYTYDAQGNVASTTDALGQTTTYTTNAYGQVTSITGPRGDRTVYTYDATGNLLTSTDPTGALTRYAYDAQGRLLQRTDALGQHTTFTYDARGHLASVTDPTGATTQFTVDLAGNVTSRTDAQGNTTRFAYDSLNQVLQITDPLGHATAYTYDAAGNRLAQIDAQGHLTTYAYNDRGQVTTVQDALQQVTTLSYGPRGCPACGRGRGNPLTQVTDATGQTTEYHYDRVGRLVTETTPLGTATTSTYDANGRPLTRTDANGATLTYAYDALGRLRTKTLPDGTTASFTYDANGNMLTAANPHIAYTFSYDLTNRITAVSDSRGLTIHYQYDALGQRTQMQYPDGSVVGYTYDPAGRLAALTHAGQTVSVAYDSLGRRAGRTLPNGATTTYAYDPTGQLTALTHRDATGAVVEPLTYTYDAVGNRTARTDYQGSAAYTYDALARLVAARPPLSVMPLESFTYDPVGNRLHSTQNGASVFNAGHQLLEDAHFTYQYDATGNRTRTTAKADGAVTTYAYDAENRLTRVVMPTGLTVAYTYDAFGRRLTKAVTDHGPTTVTQYVYDGADLLMELDEAQAPMARYTHGSGIDEALLLTQDGQTYVYHADGLGSITALTDGTGAVVQRYTYTSFGTLAVSGDAAVGQPYAFTGREWDAETGLYYYRARTYDAATGRFLQRDPIGFAGGSLNLYAYVEGNPINNTDPLGLATYQCQRRLNYVPFQIGSLFHQYVCTGNAKTGYACKGLGPTGSMFDSPGMLESDPYKPERCEKVQDDNQCIEACIQGQFQNGQIPNYSVDLSRGENCQTYANVIVNSCVAQCATQKLLDRKTSQGAVP